MKTKTERLDPLGLAAMHLSVTSQVSPPVIFEEEGLTGHRVRRWLTVLAVMRHYGLDAGEVAELMKVPEKTVHRMLYGLRRLQRTDSRVASAISRLDSIDAGAPQAA